MYRKLIKTILILIIAISVALPQQSVFADSTGILPDYVSEAYTSTRDMLIETAEELGWSEDCAWIVLGLARAGELTEDMGKAYANNIGKTLTANESNIIDAKLSSTNSKTVLTLTAAGYDVTDVAGYDLLKPLSNIGYVRSQGMNGPIWALLAFDCGAYDIPECENKNFQTTRENLIASILSTQRADYGWAYSGSSSDVDMTCMAIQALAPYYTGSSARAGEVSEETLEKVRTAVDNALQWLRDAQNEDGTFSSIGDVNSESSSQVMVALTTLGIDPAEDEDYLKDGKGAIDALMSFYVTGGGFKHIYSNYKANMLASMEGYYALAALERFEKGLTSLYDMTDTEIIYKVDESDIVGPDDPGDDEDEQGETPDSGKDDSSQSDKSDADKTSDDASRATSKGGGKISLDKEKTEKEKSALELLLDKAKQTADELPDDAAFYSDEQRDALTDIWNSYLALSLAEQRAAEADERWAAYLKCTALTGAENHRDASTGVDLTANGEDLIPWYIKLVADRYTASSEEQETINSALGEEGTLYQLYDLYFINTLDGSIWTPEGIVTVKLPLPGGFNGTPLAVHLSQSGSVEILDAAIVDGIDSRYVEFSAAEFSPYGVASIDSSLEELMMGEAEEPAVDEENDGGMMPWIALGGAGAVALLILAAARRRASQEYSEGAGNKES